MLKLTNFDDWIDFFYGWQKDIGLDAPEFKDYRFEAKYGEVSPEIEFGDYKGSLRWKTVMHIPDQHIRDAALEALRRHGAEAQVVAGGTDLVPSLKQRLFSPARPG